MNIRVRMKVITISLLCLFASLIFLTACNTNECSNKKDGRFVEVESGIIMNIEYRIVCDRTTKVMYYMSDSVYNHGNLCPLYKTDGSIMIYDYVESEE